MGNLVSKNVPRNLVVPLSQTDMSKMCFFKSRKSQYLFMSWVLCEVLSILVWSDKKVQLLFNVDKQTTRKFNDTTQIFSSRIEKDIYVRTS